MGEWYFYPFLQQWEMGSEIRYLAKSHGQESNPYQDPQTPFLLNRKTIPLALH